MQTRAFFGRFRKARIMKPNSRTKGPASQSAGGESQREDVAEIVRTVKRLTRQAHAGRRPVTTPLFFFHYPNNSTVFIAPPITLEKSQFNIAAGIPPVGRHSSTLSSPNRHFFMSESWPWPSFAASSPSFHVDPLLAQLTCSLLLSIQGLANRACVTSTFAIRNLCEQRV